MRTNPDGFRRVDVRCAVALALGVLLAGRAAPVRAVDGVLEINQAKVEGSSGFPYVISQPGSYRLTGDLTVDESTTAIRVTAKNVTIDLNGFSILGPTVCSGTPPITPFTCAPVGAGNGIVADAGSDAVTVLNGTIRGMGAAGINLGPHSRVERINAISNGGSGIAANFSSLIASNVVNGNGGTAISLGSGCTVTGNTVNNNGGGIGAQAGSSVTFNTVRGNVASGLDLGGSGTAYGNNVLNGNNAGGAQVSGGVQMGPNICNGAACP